MVRVILEAKAASGLGHKVLKGLLKMTLLSTALAGFANPLIAESLETEKRIWMSPKADLADLEGETVRLIQKDPDSAYAHYLVGLLYLRQFKADPSELRYLKQASELGQQAIEMQPDQEYGYLIAAQVLDLMGYGENSLSMLDGKDKIKIGQSWRTDFVKGLLMMDQAANDDILQQFDVALKSKEAPRDVIVPYANSAVQTAADGEELVAELTMWNKKYPHYLFQQHLAGALTSVKRYAQAHEIYKILQKSHPELVANTISDAIVVYSHLNQSKEAEKMLQGVLASATVDKVRKNIARAHLGAISLKAGHKDKARAYFADVIADADSSMEWISFAHKMYDKHKALDGFVTLLDDLRSRIPGTPYVYALQGEILSEGLNKHEKAVESFADAILLDPKRSEFYNGMGLAYYRMAQHEKALNTFHKALKLDPKDATARYNEACVLSIMGRKSEALDSLKAAISLDSRLQELASHDKDFENIRKNEQFQSLVTMTKTTKVP